MVLPLSPIVNRGINRLGHYIASTLAVWRNHKRAQHLPKKLTRRWRTRKRGPKTTYICVGAKRRKRKMMGMSMLKLGIRGTFQVDPNGQGNILVEDKP
jgi:hypothetical protein